MVESVFDTEVNARCPKCRGNQPLYIKQVQKGTRAVVDGAEMFFGVAAWVFECVRCRNLWFQKVKTHDTPRESENATALVS